MTKGPTPASAPRNEGEYARKLALAILSTLEQKGILTRFDVDTILQAAHRAAQGTPATPPPPVQITMTPTDGRTPQVPGGPAPLGTQWVKPGSAAPSGAAQPAAPRASQPAATPPAPQSIVIPSPQETEEVRPAAAQGKESSKAEGEAAANDKKDNKQPPVIDFTLD